MKKSPIPEPVEMASGTSKAGFDYREAFRRNTGYISPAEQEKLRTSRVAIAGLGGVGGAQLQALVRLGVGRFTLADPDVFELSNFNRQTGSTMQSLGRKKVEVSEEMIRSVNPDADVKLLDRGLTAETVDEFMEGADVILDALDINCFEERFLLYSKARSRNLWVINVAPPGFGATLFLFDPKGMSFEEYFDLNKNMTHEEKMFAMMTGIVPVPFPLKYIDKKAVKLKGGEFPCVSPAFFVAAGITASVTACVLLKRNLPKPVPCIYQFDAMALQFRKKVYPMGMKSLWQKLKKLIIRKIMNK